MGKKDKPFENGRTEEGENEVRSLVSLVDEKDAENTVEKKETREVGSISNSGMENNVGVRFDAGVVGLVLIIISRRIWLP